MRKVQCPECSAISFEGFLTYPVCHKCHTNLTACGYCEFFPGEGEACRRHPQRAAVRGTEVVENCTRRRSRLYVADSTHVAPLRAVVLASILISTVFGLIVAVASMVTMPVESTGGLTVHADWPRRARVGDIIQAKFTIEKDGATNSRYVKLRIPNTFFDGFKCISVSPSSYLLQLAGNYRYYCFPCSSNSDGLAVTMELQALHDGDYDLVAEVYTANNEYQGRLHRTIAIAPMVAESPNSAMSFVPRWQGLVHPYISSVP